MMNYNRIVLVFGYTLMAFLLVLFMFVSYKISTVILRWWYCRDLDGRAKVLVAAFDDQNQLSLAEVMVEERLGQGFTATNAGDEYRGRFRPRNFRRMACALAYEAYVQFGTRTRSEANMLITRKFMRDQLLGFKDLRARDAASIIDTALFLSFLPSLEYREMSVLDVSSVMEERKATLPMQSPWWWPFGHLWWWFIHHPKGTQ